MEVYTKIHSGGGDGVLGNDPVFLLFVLPDSERVRRDGTRPLDQMNKTTRPVDTRQTNTRHPNPDLTKGMTQPPHPTRLPKVRILRVPDRTGNDSGE